MERLPDFPTDDATLDLLLHALDPWSHGDPGARSSSLQDFLMMMTAMGGADPHALADGQDPDAVVVELRDPQYSIGDVVVALVRELRWHRERPWQTEWIKGGGT